MIFLKFFIIALLYCYPLICVLIIDRPSDTVDLTVDSKRKQWPGPIRWNAWFLLPSQLFFRIFFEELTDEGHGQYSPLKYKSLEFVDWDIAPSKPEAVASVSSSGLREDLS